MERHWRTMHRVNKSTEICCGRFWGARQPLQLTPQQMQTLLPTYDGTVFIQRILTQIFYFYYLREDGGRDGAQGSQERMKSRQHYVLTISPSGNSRSPELVALLHMTVFNPSQNNFFVQRGPRTLFCNEDHSQSCTLATEPPISTINVKHKWTAV